MQTLTIEFEEKHSNIFFIMTVIIIKLMALVVSNTQEITKYWKTKSKVFQFRLYSFYFNLGSYWLWE